MEASTKIRGQVILLTHGGARLAKEGELCRILECTGQLPVRTLGQGRRVGQHSRDAPIWGAARDPGPQDVLRYGGALPREAESEGGRRPECRGKPLARTPDF